MEGTSGNVRHYIKDLKTVKDSNKYLILIFSSIKKIIIEMDKFFYWISKVHTTGITKNEITKNEITKNEITKLKNEMKSIYNYYKQILDDLIYLEETNLTINKQNIIFKMKLFIIPFNSYTNIAFKKLECAGNFENELFKFLES